MFFFKSFKGNSFSDRIKDLVQSKSILLKQDYPFIDFLSIAIRPWEHFVPIQMDLENLNEQFDKVRQNESSFAEKAKRRSEWAKSMIHLDLAVTYLVKLLTLYKDCLDFEPTLFPDSVPIVTIKS